jgi:hypothetical protein
LYESCRKQKSKDEGANPSEVIITTEEGVFRPIRAGEKVDDLQKRLLSRKRKEQSHEEKELIYAVENNLFFDMELLINSDSNLAHCVDKKGNNLLHIAAKNRNQQFFEYILKRTGPSALATKNNVPANLLSSARTPWTSPNCTASKASSPSSKTILPIERDRIPFLFSWVSKIKKYKIGGCWSPNHRRAVREAGRVMVVWGL